MFRICSNPHQESAGRRKKSALKTLPVERLVGETSRSYLQAYVNMLGQLAACNRLHSVYEHCARSLLVTQDRVEGDEIRLTHEYRAMMLGTRRSGVSIAASTLQQAGFIRYAHGTIAILDRPGLESASCE